MAAEFFGCVGAAGVLGLLLAAPARGFYLPGVAPRALPRGAELRPKVNSLISEKTNLVSPSPAADSEGTAFPSRQPPN